MGACCTAPCCLSVASGSCVLRSWIKMEFAGSVSRTKPAGSLCITCCPPAEGPGPVRILWEVLILPVSQQGRLLSKLQCNFEACGLYPPGRRQCCRDTQASSERAGGGNAVVRAVHNQIIFHSWLNSRPTPRCCSSTGARSLRVSSDVPARYYGYPCAV